MPITGGHGDVNGLSPYIRFEDLSRVVRLAYWLFAPYA